MEEKYFKIGVIYAFTSIIIGAFGTHLLKDLVSLTELYSFKTGLKYQFFHALGIITLSLNSDKFTDRLKIALALMCIGVLLFSFSIYFLAINNLLDISMRFLGPITPVGGIILIISWIILLFNVKKNDITNI